MHEFLLFLAILPRDGMARAVADIRVVGSSPPILCRVPGLFRLGLVGSDLFLRNLLVHCPKLIKRLPSSKKCSR